MGERLRRLSAGTRWLRATRWRQRRYRLGTCIAVEHFGVAAWGRNEGREVAGALIRFVCRSSDHQHGRIDLSNPVTLHQHEWAFCPAGLTEGHTWERIEGAGATLDALRRHVPEARVKV
jgi:hypothetical protein